MPELPDLTVFLAPDPGAASVLDVLADLSGAGMIRPFHWVRGADAGTAGYGAVEVTGGRRHPATVQETIVDRRVRRVRLCVLVPLVSAPEPVPSAVEQDLVSLLSSNVGGAPVTRMRCLLTRGGDLVPDSDDLVREGWHNLLVAPERALGPGSGRWVLPVDTPPADAAALLAPAVAGIVGLWEGAEGCALDELPIPTGKTVRAARAFYRRVEAGEVEDALRSRVLTSRPQLPLPRQQSGPATTYLGDPGAACATMAGHLWRRHRIDRGPDADVVPANPPPVSTLALLRWLPTFLVAVARSNPQRWFGSLLGWVRAAVAQQDQVRAVATLPPSSGDLVRGSWADGMPLGWSEVGRIADEIDASLPPLPGRAPQPDGGPDNARLWQDFADGALTLADADDRNPDMPPAQAGSARAVVERVGSCVPGPEADFAVPAENVAARTGIPAVQAGDRLGADVLRRRLVRLERELSLADARPYAAVRGALGEWEAGQSATYAYQAALPIAARLHDVGGELRTLVADLLAASRPPELAQAERDRQLRLGQVLLGVAAAGVLVLLVIVLPLLLTVGAATGVLITGGVALLLAVAVPALGYRIGLRRTFRELGRYRALTARVEADQPRLRRALREYRRLRDLYSEYLMWSRAVAVVLADPFGRAAAESAPGGPEPLHGLPPSVRVGHAVTDQDALPTAAAALRADHFVTGWLSGPWRGNLRTAVRRFVGNPPPGVRAGQVLTSRAYPGGDLPLRSWCDHLVATGPDRATGEQVWSDVLANLDRHRLGDLPLRIQGAEPLSLADFLAGVDTGDDSTHRFDAAHFTSSGQIQNRAQVVLSAPFGSRRGLSRVHVLVQLSDAFPAWDLELGTDGPPEHGAPEPDDEFVF